VGNAAGRQLSWAFVDRPAPIRFLIRDHDPKFTSSFDSVFESQGTRIVRTPIQAPEANAFCERLIATIRRECLDWLIVLNERHLRFIQREWVVHYNQGRPHASLGPGIPDVPREKSIVSGVGPKINGDESWRASPLSRMDR
jgi:putative transposase